MLLNLKKKLLKNPKHKKKTQPEDDRLETVTPPTNTSTLSRFVSTQNVCQQVYST